MSLATAPKPTVVDDPQPQPIAPPVAGDPYALLAVVPPMRVGGFRFGHTVPSALEALRANKGRSILTALGIIIGVAAVIAVVALGQGASASVAGQLQGLGTDVLTLSPASARSGGVAGGAGTASSLKLADVAAIVADVEGIRAISPVVTGNAQIINGNQNWQTRIQGVTVSYFGIQNWQISNGAFFSEQDDQSARNVAVLGQTVVTNLFPNGQDPLGQVVRIRNVPFTVIGVLASKGSGIGGDQDDTVFIPFNTGQIRLFGTVALNSVVVQGAVGQNLTALSASIQTFLRGRHNLRISQPDDFTIRNNNDLIQRVEGVSQTLTLLLGSVAVISLIVGGIGIMNIMLVSVTERTREIGIRMAIGARPNDILAQFLVEALVISLLGGLLGVTIGALVAFLLPIIAGWATSLSWVAAALAFGSSAFIGIFFGIYPARKASRLDPIEALRYQ